MGAVLTTAFAHGLYGASVHAHVPAQVPCLEGIPLCRFNFQLLVLIDQSAILKRLNDVLLDALTIGVVRLAAGQLVRRGSLMRPAAPPVGMGSTCHMGGLLASMGVNLEMLKVF